MKEPEAFVSLGDSGCLFEICGVLVALEVFGLVDLFSWVLFQPAFSVSSIWSPFSSTSTSTCCCSSVPSSCVTVFVTILVFFMFGGGRGFSNQQIG